MKNYRASSLSLKLPIISLVLITNVILSFSSSAEILTRDNGAPIGDNENSLSAGENGPVLLQDGQLIQKLQRFDRERIPERVVHARGTGVYGSFTATKDISALTLAEVFTPGTQTPVFVRFSAVVHGNHSPETLRDPRGFATKFYTKQGNWDLVGNNFPVFFIRDAIKFPDMVHAFKPDPSTNIDNDARQFDFFSYVPEATHGLTMLYSNAGTPANYRQMDGNSVHAYKFINAKNQVNYVKFRWKSTQGIKNLTPKQVAEVQKTSYSHMTEDLVNAINKGNYPKWELMIQTISEQEITNFAFNPLDATKIWPNVPEVKIGEMVLNRNVSNFFQETEQVAMAPSNLIPGIEPSEDKLLQGRLFSYADTQMYRLGANHSSIPVNKAQVPVRNGNQDGATNTLPPTTKKENYQPSRDNPVQAQSNARTGELSLNGNTQRTKIAKEQNFKQAGELYRSFTELEKTDLIHSLGGALSKATSENKNIMLSYFYKADKTYGERLTGVAHGDIKIVKEKASMLNDE